MFYVMETRLVYDNGEDDEVTTKIVTGDDIANVLFNTIFEMDFINDKDFGMESVTTAWTQNPDYSHTLNISKVLKESDAHWTKEVHYKITQYETAEYNPNTGKVKLESW